MQDGHHILIIRKIQIKSTLRFHLTSVESLQSRNQEFNNYWWSQSIKNASVLLAGGFKYRSSKLGFSLIYLSLQGCVVIKIPQKGVDGVGGHRSSWTLEDNPLFVTHCAQNSKLKQPKGRKSLFWLTLPRSVVPHSLEGSAAGTGSWLTMFYSHSQRRE